MYSVLLEEGLYEVDDVCWPEAQPTDDKTNKDVNI
jgi:hypothetical protein